MSITMDPQQRSEEFFHALRNDRIAARTLLSDQQLFFYDTRLATRAENAMDFPQNTRIGSISRLLNKGATLVYQSTHVPPNLADILDFIEDKTNLTHIHYILSLLEQVVTSACYSWVANFRFSGTDSVCMPKFLTALVVKCDVWGSCIEKDAIQMHHCHRAWSILQKMVWAYEHDRRTERHPICRARLVTELLLYFLRYISHRERAAPLDPAELQLFDTIVDFFRVRTTIARTIRGMSRWYVTPLSAELLLRIDPKLFQNWHARYASPYILNNFLSNRTCRRNMLNLLKYENFRAYILQPEFVRDLCRRKEPVIFERLYSIDPKRVMDFVPFALQVLESKFVRGRKERLIAFFKSIQDAQ